MEELKNKKNEKNIGNRGVRGMALLPAEKISVESRRTRDRGEEPAKFFF